MDRRSFIKKAGIAAGGAAAASTLAAPAVAQGKKELVIVSTWPRDFPGLGISAQRLAARITELSEGRITTKYFAAGERVGAFDSFDHVASGDAQAYIAADYYWKGKHPGWAYFTTVPFGMTTIEWNAWVKFGGGQAAVGRSSRRVRFEVPGVRCDRHADGRLVQQGNRIGRRSQRPQNAHSRPRR